MVFRTGAYLFHQRHQCRPCRSKTKMGFPQVSVFCVALLSFLGYVRAQVPVLSQASTDGSTVCADKLDNCNLFPEGSCRGVYERWARDNCALTCQYCQGPPTTPLPCVDVLTNCASYEQSACTEQSYHAWALANCRLHCRLCPADRLPPVTTISPENCVDKLDCRQYGRAICNDSTYTAWAKDNCLNFCHFCEGTPTTPPPCLDMVPNCAMYEQGTCTNPSYDAWVEDNCRAYCGRCSGPTTLSTTPQHFQTPPPLPNNTPMQTPPMPGRK